MQLALPPNKANPPSAGFTLVELLVVIAIIAVLAMMLMPVVTRSIAAAQATKCVGNLKQIYTASTLWSLDNNGRIPPMNDCGPQFLKFSIKPDLTTLGHLAPYLGHSSTEPFQSTAEFPVFVCPANPKQWGYGLNYFYLSWGATVPIWKTFAEMGSRPGGLSKILFFCDNEWAADNGKPGSDFLHWSPYVRPPSFFQSAQDVRVSYRHPGKTANVLWLDGHVSSEKADGIFNDRKDTYWGNYARNQW